MLEEYQRTLIVQMNDEIDGFENGSISLGELVDRIRGLCSAADISNHDLGCHSKRPGWSLTTRRN